MRVFLIIFIIFTQRSFQNIVIKEPKSSNILPAIIRTEKFHDLIILFHNKCKDEETINFFNKMLRSVLRTLPIQFGTSLCGKNRISIPTASHTLIIQIYFVKKVLNFTEIKEMIDVLYELSRTEQDGTVHKVYKPKILFMIISSSKNNFTSLFRYSWTYKILDITILEILKSEDITGDINAGMTIHRYNPFTDAYTKENYSTNTTWFPNKTLNIHGYPLTIDIFNRPAFSHVKRNQTGHIIEYDSVDAMALRTIAHYMNFTVNLIPHTTSIIFTRGNGNLDGPLGGVVKRKTEMIATTFPMLISEFFFEVEHTRSFRSEKWCAVVPLMYQKTVLGGWNLLTLLLFSCLIVYLFWLFSNLLRFDAELWHPLKITRIMLGAPTLKLPSSSPERIILICCVVVSTRYSIILYTELMSLKLLTDSEVVFENLDDLMEAGLTPILHSVLYDVIDETGDLDLARLKKESLYTSQMSNCADYMVAHKNVSCVMEETMAKEALYTKTFKGEPGLRITNLCFWSYPVAYIFRKGSPFIERVSDILSRIHESGLVYKWLYDHLRNKRWKAKHEEQYVQNKRHNVRLYRQLLYVAIGGCIISCAIFLGEMIAYRLTISKVPKIKDNCT